MMLFYSIIVYERLRRSPSLWVEWKCLDRLRTGTGQCKETLKKWGYLIATMLTAEPRHILWLIISYDVHFWNSSAKPRTLRCTTMLQRNVSSIGWSIAYSMCVDMIRRRLWRCSFKHYTLITNAQLLKCFIHDGVLLSRCSFKHFI